MCTLQLALATLCFSPQSRVIVKPLFASAYVVKCYKHAAFQINSSGSFADIVMSQLVAFRLYMYRYNYTYLLVRYFMIISNFQSFYASCTANTTMLFL